MNKIVDWKIYIKTVSEANSSEHWSKKHKRHKLQKKALAWKWLEENPSISLPCKVKLSRIAPRLLDFGDNLPVSMKYIRDAIADKIIPGLAVGRADDDPNITWDYGQERGGVKEYAVRIEIFS